MKPIKYFNISYKCNNCNSGTINFIKSNYEIIKPYICHCGSIDVEQEYQETEYSKNRKEKL